MNQKRKSDNRCQLFWRLLNTRQSSPQTLQGLSLAVSTSEDFKSFLYVVKVHTVLFY